MMKTIQLILMQIVKVMFWLKFITNSNLLVLELVFLQILFNIVFEHVFFQRCWKFFDQEIFYLHSCLMKTEQNWASFSPWQCSQEKRLNQSGWNDKVITVSFFIYSSLFELMQWLNLSVTGSQCWNF